MLKAEPIKGKLYAIFSRDHKGRREGITIGRFINREYHGCQLHGDRIGYNYVFARNDVESHIAGCLGTVSVYVRYEDGEKDFSIVLNQLSQSVMPLPDDFNPFELFQHHHIKEKEPA